MSFKSIIIAVVAICLYSCKHGVKGIGKPEAKSHYLEIRERGIGMISIDKVSNSLVMKVKPNERNTFFSYMVGFMDSSMVVDKKKKLDINKYYQYDMYKDWVALVQGDSVRPVFFQPAIKRMDQLNEGVIVFEMPSGIEPDTLVYLDSYEKWGRHQIFLNK